MPTADDLVNAAQDGDAERIRDLIAAGAAPNAADGTGVTPLHAAASSRSLASVVALLDAGADVNRVGENGKRLTLAPYTSAEILAAMIRHGLEIDEPDADGTTQLYSVAVAGETDKVRLLLDAGAAVDQASHGFSEGTPLCAACCWGYVDTRARGLLTKVLGSTVPGRTRSDGMPHPGRG